MQTVHTDQQISGNLFSVIISVACFSPICDGAPRLCIEQYFNI